MAFSSGTFSLISGNPVVTGTTISSTWANNTLSDIATGLTTCLLKDGTQTATANITFSGYSLLNTPVHIGGTAAGSNLELRSTSGVGTTDYIKLTTGNNGATEVARAVSTNGGALCVGTTATSSNNERFNVTRNGNVNLALFENDSASNTSNLVTLNCPNIAGGTGFDLLAGANSGGVCLNIFGNGNITNTNNSYGAISDAKIKDVVGLSGSQWEDVKALGKLVSKYTLKADPEQRVQIGWIAQDVQKVSPGLVFESPDTELRDVEVPDSTRNIVAEDGSVLIAGTRIEKHKVPTGTVTLGIQHSVAHMKAFKALEEALERIEALEAKIGP